MTKNSKTQSGEYETNQEALRCKVEAEYESQTTTTQVMEKNLLIERSVLNSSKII